MTQRRQEIWIGCGLFLLTFMVYWQLSHHVFVSIDDNAYVTNNRWVKAGITVEGLKWAFSSLDAEFWHPLTWLSLMLDTQLFGVNPGGYHLSNLLLHALNTVLLFLFLNRTSRALGRSAIVAALFALHPLHVESVAWIAQRKDVLSCMFWFLTLLSYARYVERPCINRYLWVVIFLVLGLMAKPMLVTLPFVLLVCDYWPLARLNAATSDKSITASFSKLVVEKIPLFALSMMASALAYFAQKSGGGIGSVEAFPLKGRIFNSLAAYVTYIAKTIWPEDLTFFYLYDARLPAWQVANALLVLSAFSTAFILRARQYPYLIAGWFWYLGTLVPVIGIVKIGDFAFADRYTYIPLTGLFIIMAWGIPELMSTWKRKTMLLAGASIILMTSLVWATVQQTRHWQNSLTLYRHALQIDNNNYLAHHGLGHLLASQDNLVGAAHHFRQAVRVKPKLSLLRIALGRALGSQGNFAEAIEHLSAATRINPNSAEAHYYLGLCHAAENRLDAAVLYLSEALRLHLRQTAWTPEKFPSAAENYNLGQWYENEGDICSAIQSYEQALSSESRFYPAVARLANLYAMQHQQPQALQLLAARKSSTELQLAMINGFDRWELTTK